MNNRKPTKQIDRHLTLEGEAKHGRWWVLLGLRLLLYLLLALEQLWRMRIVVIWLLVIVSALAAWYLMVDRLNEAKGAEPVMVSVDFQSPASWRYFFTVIRGWKFVDQGPQAENRGREYCANHGELIGLEPGESLFIGFQKIGRMRIERCVESYPPTPKEAQTFCVEYGMTLQTVVGTVVTCSREIGA